MIRITLKTWTSSFRYPTFQSGYQPTLYVPPISTVLGLLSAAKGDIVSLEDVEYIGYIFINNGLGIDLEKTYMLGEKQKADVLKREILVDNILYLYLPNEWETFFLKPKYQLLLGRSCDLVSIEEIKKVDLKQRQITPFSGVILPLELQVSGQIFTLPIEFKYENGLRKIKKVKPFVIISFSKKKRKYFQGNHPKVFFDEELDLGVYLYDKSLLS